MSGLDTFVASVTQFGVGFNSGNTGATVSGALYLAHTNTINTGGGFSGVGSAMIVGGGGSGNGQLFLGQSNALYVDGITMGIATSGNGLITFNPAFSNSPVAYIRGTLGDASRVTLWSLGDSTVNLNNSTPNGNLTNDFTAGKLDAMVNTLAVGQGSQGNTAPPSGTVPFKGMFNMGQGKLDVTTLKVGMAASGNPGGIGVGIMSVSNGTVIAGTLALPASTFASGAGVAGTSGTLSLTNATLIVSNSITVAANSGGGTLNAIGSTVKVLGGTVGGLLTPIVNLTLDGGSLQLPVDGTAVSAVLTATTITTGAPTTINIGSIANVASPVQLPLIGFNGVDPYPALVLGTYPAGYTVTLVDNVVNNSVDVSITPTAAPSTPHITSISISGPTLHLTATNGNSNAQFALLSSTNVSLPLSQWTPVLTNNFDSNGNLKLSTKIIDPSVRLDYYMLRTP
jgi:hypothetical protein